MDSKEDDRYVFNPEVLPDLLPVYYKRLFPFSLYYRWMTYGNLNKNYFPYREFSFTLQDDIYLRYQSFMDQTEMEREVQKKCPYKIDIGAVYSFRPREHRTVSTFQPLEKELVFDIDMTDYDEVRNCCSGTNICKKCWPFIVIAMKILDRALKEDFGFQHLLWVYSGRRGVHCWVCDEVARKLTSTARSAIAEYLTVVKGGKFKTKKVQLGENIHPSIRKAKEIIQKYFNDLMLENQEIMETEEKWEKIVEFCTDGKLKENLQQRLAKSTNSKECWEAFKETVSYAIKKGESRKCANLVTEIMLQFCYPRLDINVTKGLNHLLKAPFCVHPKTGRICVPIDIQKVDKFDPFSVPTVSQLCEEINIYDANNKANQEEIMDHSTSDNSNVSSQEGNEKKSKIKDYKKTSLIHAVKVFEEFVLKLEASVKGKRLEMSDMKREF